MTPPSRPRVLSIAGTDPTGGAGIHADLKSFAAHGAYGMAVVTALVAQNTHGVRATHVPGVDFLRAQLDAVGDDVGVDAVKVGMVATRETADEIGRWLGEHRPPFVVVDPVMVATSGHRLLDEGAETAVNRLVGLADLVTPNLPELAVLLGEPVATSWSVALRQATRLAEAEGLTVLLKGGHLGADQGSPDAVVSPAGIVELPSPRVDSTSTHGTGCSLSAAVAALRPRRPDWVTAVTEAKEWLTGAIAAGDALGVGSGRGPVDHFHHAPALGVAPVTTEAWAAAAGLREACDALPFVQRLADGTLPVDAFEEYLQQDVLYLREYSRVLARVSQLAPTVDAQEFFARAAHDCLVIESGLHRRRLAGRPLDREAPASAVTRGYTDHLHALAARGGYAELVAAVLPCYWLYSDLGQRMLLEARAVADHRYADWIATYGDDAFAGRSERARGFVDAAAREAGPATRARMLDAFARSFRHELAFFGQVQVGSAGAVRAQVLVGGAQT